jgi:hypothetical protein
MAVLVICAVLWKLFVPSPHPRSPAAQRPGPGRAAPTARPLPSPAPSVPSPSNIARVDPVEPPPGKELGYFDQLARADSRRRIRSSAGYTYLSDVVAASADSSLHRWDDRADRPVRVYLSPGTVENYQPAFLGAIRSAFERWMQAGVPVGFDANSDSARAEVVFQWTLRFPIERTGQTNLTWDEEGRIQSGVVTIATEDPKGQPLTPDDVRVVALHEIGHLLGLDHSPDSSDVMYASTRVRDLSPRDIRTAVLLYQLAPGSLR